MNHAIRLVEIIGKVAFELTKLTVNATIALLGLILNRARKR
jgi:hypothetical protein